MKIFQKLLVISSALSILFLIPAFFAVAGASDIQATLKNIDKYSKGIRIGTKYEDAAKRLGKPMQKKALTNKASSFTAVWKLDKYTVDVSVGDQNVVDSYGIHWFAAPDKIPDFKDIYAGEFESETRKKSKISRQINNDLVICWTKKPVKGRPEIISVLSVIKAKDKSPVCRFRSEIRK